MKRILIVDDDPETVAEFMTALNSNNIKADFAFDGFDACRKIYKDKPDLVLLDFLMPGMDGFRVCRQLRDDEETKNIPIIAVTVLTSEESRVKIKECGIDTCIEKPVDVEELVKLIKDTLKIGSAEAKD